MDTLITRRWLPFMALCLGAICFAALALLLIPDRFGNAHSSGKEAVASADSSVDSPIVHPGPTPRSALSASRTESVNAPHMLESSARVIDAPPARRGFSPALERAESRPSYARLAPPGAFATPDQPAPPLNPADFPPLPPNPRAELANEAEPAAPDALPLPQSDP